MKVEGAWCTEKEILGWTINGLAFFIELPPRKLQKLIKLIKTELNIISLSMCKSQKIFGVFDTVQLKLRIVRVYFNLSTQHCNTIPSAYTSTLNQTLRLICGIGLHYSTIYQIYIQVFMNSYQATLGMWYLQMIQN